MPPFEKTDVNQNHPLVCKARQAVYENSMLAPGSRVLTAVSGGPDSVALLHVLSELGREHGYGIGVAHVNHGLRGASADREAAFVEALAKKQNVPYYEKRIDVLAIQKKTGGCLEEAGRNARYAFFHETADRYGFDRIAVGHHQDDDAEVILMNIIRGSGATGMAGIAPVRGRIVRPLIHSRREEILQFLDSLHIEYAHDKSNDDTRFQRNHIRHCLMPALEYYNPRVVENLHKLGQITGLENRWIEELISPVFDAVVTHRSEGRLVIDAEKAAGHHAAVKRRMVRKAVYGVKGDLRRIGLAHIEAVTGLMDKTGPSVRLDLPDRIRVSRSGASLIFTAEKASLRSPGLSGRQSAVADYAYTVTENQAASGGIDIPETGSRIVLTRMAAEDMDSFPAGDAAAFDWDKLTFPLSVRNWRPGDRFTPLGMPRTRNRPRTQKLADFFINNKVPAEKRGRVPIVTSGGAVVWIAGFRMDDRFRITPETKTVLTARVINPDSKYTQSIHSTRAEDI